MRFVALFVVALALGCTPAPGSPLNPKTGPGTDYPCGIAWHSCGGGDCCPNGEYCGAPATSCPADSCCPSGEELGKHSPPTKKRHLAD